MNDLSNYNPQKRQSIIFFDLRCSIRQYIKVSSSILLLLEVIFDFLLYLFALL